MAATNTYENFSHSVIGEIAHFEKEVFNWITVNFHDMCDVLCGCETREVLQERVKLLDSVHEDMLKQLKTKFDVFWTKIRDRCSQTPMDSRQFIQFIITIEKWEDELFQKCFKHVDNLSNKARQDSN